MKARLNIVVLALLAATMMILMALPAASDEHDRPDDVPPDEPTAEVEDPQGEDEGGVGTATHGQSGDFDDFVSIRNQTGTGQSRLNLNATDSIVINSDTWRLANDADTGNFLIQEGGTTNRLVMRQGGNVGLGTDNPLSPMHIERSGGFQLRMQGSGADYRMDAFGTSLRIGDSSNTNQFRIFGADAPFNALTVGNGIGIGTASPQDALDIHNITGAATARLRITNGEHSWANGVLPGGLFQFNKFGTGGSEFVVRERNHPTATLDVDGAVRATAFKTSSSRAFKTETQSVDPLGVLRKLNSLPIDSWRFKGCAPGEGRLPNEDGAAASPCSGGPDGPRHLGPMAEDFHEVFGLGDGESIASVDADGVIMAAIQGLTQLVEERDKTISELEGQVSDLEARLDALEAQANGASPRGGPNR